VGATALRPLHGGAPALPRFPACQRGINAGWRQNSQGRHHPLQQAVATRDDRRIQGSTHPYHATSFRPDSHLQYVATRRLFGGEQWPTTLCLQDGL